MVSNELKNLIKERHIVFKVIWLAMGGSIFIYLGVAYIITTKNTNVPEVNNIIPIALSLFSLSSIVLSFLVDSFFITKNRVLKYKNGYEKVENRYEVLKFLTDKQRDRFKELSDYEKKVFAVYSNMAPVTITKFLLIDFVPIIGLVVTILTGDIKNFIPFLIVGFSLHFYHAPKESTLIEKIEKFIED